MELIELVNALKTFEALVVFLSFVICIGTYFIRALSKGQKEFEYKLDDALKEMRDSTNVLKDILHAMDKRIVTLETLNKYINPPPQEAYEI